MARIAVVGAGYWGPNLIRNFFAHKSCTELWVCDANPVRLAHVRERFPGLTFTQSYDEVLRSQVDGVVIATPVGTHHELAKQALAHGKHVFVEKPLAASVSQARDLVERAARAGRSLMVGHTFEYSPPVVKIRELIEQGELGRIFFVSSMRVNLGLHQKDISVIWDLAPHDFSILFSWLKERPSSISATGRAFVQKGIHDVAFISVDFPSGAIAHIEVSWLAPSKLRRTAVVGDRKMVVYDDTEAIEKVKIFDRGVDFRDPETFGEFQLSYRTGDILSPKLGQSEPLQLETLEFLSAIDEGATPRTHGESGLRVVEALAAAQESLEQDGVPVKL
ncbi:MAG: Gfo/Idh/MocA family oxidoreductase [Deltaproteobacteria bacterium]|nr:Gfo/Idh/MocA family oxidoreductase [Deltaproteobacteria bacterium]